MGFVYYLAVVKSRQNADLGWRTMQGMSYLVMPDNQSVARNITV